MEQERRGLASLGPLHIGPHVIACPVILAPMAGVSEAPFREMALRAGAGLAPTELVSAKGLELGDGRTEAYLRHDPAKEPLLAVQIFGGEPDSMARAAELAVSRGAKIVDINMGCPVKKVTRNGAGSALMADASRAQAMVRAMRQRAQVPITAKIRAGWDDQQKNAVEFGLALEDAGLAAIAIHPRTRAQGYSGRADWSLIRALKQALRIPVIANGDIDSVAAADRVVQETGCDAVMIGRAALGNPWVLGALAAAFGGKAAPAPPTPSERSKTVAAHLAQHVEHVGDELRAVRKFRQHLIWYSRGLRGGAHFRTQVMNLDDRERVEALIAGFFSSADFTGDEAPLYDERAALG